jgi:DNA-binding PadR family transcriptional regulator
MEANGLLKKEERVVNGKVRKYYSITDKGCLVLEKSKQKAFELFKEIKD